jgi:dihydroorotase
VPYDLVIKGGHVLDPGQGLNGRMDIGISDGRIAAIQPDIPPGEAKRTIEVRGQNRYVVPGLIDLHTHVAYGATTLGVGMQCCDPDQIGVRAGVTTVADGGSVGVANIGVFPFHIIPKAKTRILPFVNVGSYAHTMPGWADVARMEDVDQKAIAACIEANPGLIRGLKLRLVGPVAQEQGEALITLCKEISREHHLPLMVHIGDMRASDYSRASEVTRFLLKSFEPGDILTHLATPHAGGVMADEARTTPVPELAEARARGVVLDPALGAGNFGFDLARRQADIGLHPDTISSDLTGGGRGRIVYSLMECMGRFMAAGYTVEDMVRMSTVNAARALGMENEIGALATGREADITILEVVNGRWKFVDTVQKEFTGDKALAPVLTIRAGEAFEPEWGPHPWGWLPETMNA